jgi:dihydroxyacetone kinase-like protein
VRKALDSSSEAPTPELLTKLALAMGSVGGAIGPIYATGLLAIAGSLRGVAADAPLTVERALRCAEAADAAIAGLGHAKPGDKTILDALNPAVDALRAAHASDASIDDALVAAARAARKGAESTASMIAAVGRASRLGERSRGLADPGASSFALIMDSLAARA